jgi:hypothetical protein
MRDPAYIAIGPDGHVTLYWGDGTEQHKEVIIRGPRVANSREFIEVIEEMKTWAEENGYTVIVPSYDFEPLEAVEINIPDEEAEQITYDDVDDLMDDLFAAENDDEDQAASPDDERY